MEENVIDGGILAGEASAARLESSGRGGGNAAGIQSAAAAAATHGKSLRKTAEVADLAPPELPDAADAATYRYRGHMTTSGAPAMRLMDNLVKTSISWRTAVQNPVLVPELLSVIEDIAPALDGNPVVFSIGMVFHNAPQGPQVLESWLAEPQNGYDLTVFTRHRIVTAWGSFRENGQEPVTLMARKDICRVTVNVRPGDVRSDGTTSTHHEATLSFVDGSEVQLPGVEENLTETGSLGLADLLTDLYKDVSR
ncbi:hypothetical protein [Arthrobacter oryzae]|uniref:Uncharacterized protein n=1 Tax=Arthrobacter oryzae TaxID=409290 RepID=A0A3N0C4U5_9MICC|nr:hypothetical protein [Arthrobacter oryzae]RNL57915.1 hypothetical protein D7003_05055 [Arthrobacter oryzae]